MLWHLGPYWCWGGHPLPDQPLTREGGWHLFEPLAMSRHSLLSLNDLRLGFLFVSPSSILSHSPLQEAAPCVLRDSPLLPTARCHHGWLVLLLFSNIPRPPVTAVAPWVPHRWTLESAGDSVPLSPQVCLPADHGLIFLWLPLTQTPQPRPCSFSSFPVSLAFLPACTLWSAAVSTTYSFVLLTLCIRPWQGHGPEQVKPSLFSALVLQLYLIMEKNHMPAKLFVLGLQEFTVSPWPFRTHQKLTKSLKIKISRDNKPTHILVCEVWHRYPWPQGFPPGLLSRRIWAFLP